MKLENALPLLVLVFVTSHASADDPRLELFLQTGHTQRVTSVAMSGDGKLVATASWDRTATLWETASGRKLQTFQGTESVTSVALSGDGKFVVAAAGNGAAFLWDAVSGKTLQTF